MPSDEVQKAHPGVTIVTRDEDWIAFFRSQIWKDFKAILVDDYTCGIDMLVDVLLDNTNRIGWFRGRISAFKEMSEKDEEILKIIRIAEVIEEVEEEVEEVEEEGQPEEEDDNVT